MVRRLIFLSLAALLVMIPARAQDGGRGLIVEGTTADLENIGSFNPLRCGGGQACAWAVERLFPMLLAVDPQTGLFTAGTAGNNGLAADWTLSDDNLVYTLTLRPDAVWSDGEPITAYDVFFSYLAVLSNQIGSSYRDQLVARMEGIVPLDASRVALILKEVNCDALPGLDIPIIPAHAFDPDFAARADAFFNPDDDASAQWAAWKDAVDYDFSFMVGHPFDERPLVTGGLFTFDSWLRTEYIRLQRGDVAFELRSVPNETEQMQQFLDGDLTLVQFSSPEWWPELAARPDVLLADRDLPAWAYIAFNLADPQHPHSAVDRHGNPLDQGIHPILGDVRVRRAIQLAIDPQEILQIMWDGHGEVMPADQVPLSAAYDNMLAPLGYDPEAARALLFEAGWHPVEGRSARLCIGCLYAAEETPLSLTLTTNGGSLLNGAAAVVARQLERVGINVVVSTSSFSEAQQQRFDLYLGLWAEYVPVELDHSMSFTPAGDVIGSGYNVGSYANPALTDLLDRARTLPGCDINARVDLYHQAQRILQDDPPYVWLFSLRFPYAVHDSVLNFDPAPVDPLWNIGDWVVWR